MDDITGQCSDGRVARSDVEGLAAVQVEDWRQIRANQPTEFFKLKN